MNITMTSSFLFFTFLLLLLISPYPTQSTATSIHDLLKSKGLPRGLLPKDIRSYNFSQTGLLQVFLDQPCLTQFENRLYFDSFITANLSYGGLGGVVGLSQEELFLWLPVKGILVDDPHSGLIQFDIGVAHKQLSISLFEDPPSCKTDEILKSNVRKEKGFEAGR